MSTSPPVLPNELWADILQHLPLETLWYSTRPVCTLFYHVSTNLVKSVLVDGSSCELRHYISFKDPLLNEMLYYAGENNEYHRRILEQEGHTPFSQILLWASLVPSPARPISGPGIPTVNYESADGKKCVTMAVFGQQQSRSSSTSTTKSSHGNFFHCRRTGCILPEETESVTDGHVCLAGCWHVHYSRKLEGFCATIPLSILLPVYLRLEASRREKTTDRWCAAVERKGRWSSNVGGRGHGISASVSPLPEFEDVLMQGSSSNETVEDDEGQGTLMEWSEDEDGYGDSLIDVYTDHMEVESNR